MSRCIWLDIRNKSDAVTEAGRLCGRGSLYDDKLYSLPCCVDAA